MLRSFVYLFRNNKALHFYISYETEVNISKSFRLRNLYYMHSGSAKFDRRKNYNVVKIGGKNEFGEILMSLLECIN